MKLSFDVDFGTEWLEEMNIADVIKDCIADTLRLEIRKAIKKDKGLRRYIDYKKKELIDKLCKDNNLI